MVKAASNPQAMISQIMQNNPNFKTVQEIGQKYNGNFKQAFYDTAKEMGVDPDEFLKDLM